MKVKKIIQTWNEVKLEDCNAVSEEIKKLLDVPSIIILSGPVGAGKTTFVKFFSRETRVGNSVNSPTYSIINTYQDVIHGDFYRIQDKSEITFLELELYLDDFKYFFIEWGADFFSEIFKEIIVDCTFYELEIIPDSQNINRKFELREINL